MGKTHAAGGWNSSGTDRLCCDQIFLFVCVSLCCIVCVCYCASRNGSYFDPAISIALRCT